MMRGLCLLLALAVFPTVGFSVDPARLVSDLAEYDFGTVDQSAVVTNVFTLRNVGDLSYAVKAVRTSCSCTRGKVDERIIGPGQTAQLTAVFKAARRQGPQKKSLRVVSADSSLPSLTVYMKGFVAAP